MHLRSYQKRIAAACVRANTVVLLPTGAGKTLIAAESIMLLWYASNNVAKTLFLVPTIPLVAQQAAALRAHPDMPTVGEYNGELSMPLGFSVLVTTPKAFETCQDRVLHPPPPPSRYSTPLSATPHSPVQGEPTFAWSQFSTVVFDEVHHVIKDHPYRYVYFKPSPKCCHFFHAILLIYGATSVPVL